MRGAYRMGMHWLTWAASCGATATALALAGCGGSSHNHTGSSSQSSATAAKSEFVAKLDSLCNQTNAAYQSAPSVAGATSAVKRYMPRFSSLEPPASLASLYSRYTAVLEQELAQLERGHQTQVTRLAQTKARPLAVQLGATDCANPR
jgi:hypothetical protein